MVDHRADAPSALDFSGAGGDDWRGGALSRAGDWLRGLVSFDSEGSPRGYALPIAVTGVWLMALGAYAVGYFDRLNTDALTGTHRALPTMDLMFFAFAAVGPVLMLWMVVLLQARAARVTEALTAQSESALALAATVASLHEAVETLSAGTKDKIADAASVLERDGARAMARLDAALAELSDKLETGMLEAVVTLDRNLRERSAKADAALDAQRNALARRLDDDAGRLARRLEDDAERLASSIEAQARGLEAAQNMLGERIADSLAAHGNRFERGTAELLEALGAQMADIGNRVDAALTSLADNLAAAQRDRHRDLDADMRRRELRIQAAVEEVARAIEGGVAPLMGELRTALAETQEAIASHPPASADQLARLLGEAATRQVAPERAALAAAVEKLAVIEDQARGLVERIDRTARLNPLMEPGAATPEAGTAALPELPFAALPRGAARAALNWTAVIHALDGRPAGEAGRRVISRAAADPDVAALSALTARIAGALAEDGLHLADLSPVHAPAALWHRFALGERGEEIAGLAGIEDDITLAITRARLRDDPAFRAQALRLVDSWTRLIGRAAADIGPDPRLVELADTPPGRAFILLGELTHAFRPVPLTPA